MGRIVCVASNFPIIRNGREIGREFVTSHGIDEDTLQDVVLPNEHPAKLGAIFDRELGEWVIEEAQQQEPARPRPGTAP
jgi:hypothetical protein